jgi:hypothetical protein
MSTGGAAEAGGSGDREGGVWREPGVVGGARKSLERLRVEAGEQASADGKETLVNRAKATWNKLKGMLLGKKLVMDEMGGGRVQNEGGEKRVEGREIELEFLTGEGEEGEIAIVEVGEERDNVSVSSDGMNSIGGVSFLECLGEEERDEEVEKKLEGTKKRGREEGGEVKLKGLLNTRGWEEREREVKDEARWVVKTRERSLDGNGTWKESVREGRIPLPDSYRLGLEGKGVDLNNSSRYRNEFGKNSRPLFPAKGKGRGEETRNWIASFNRTGCIGCKDGNDSVHKGRDGKPVVLVVGDEAVPMTVGITKKEGEGGCCWVLKKST